MMQPMKVFALAAITAQLADTCPCCPTCTICPCACPTCGLTPTTPPLPPPVTCSSFQCPIGKMPRPDAASTAGSDEATCCLPTCHNFACPAGQLLRGDADTMQGTDAGTCCEPACSSFACPDGHLPRSDAAAIKGSDAATCCEQTCSSFTCPDGQMLRSDAATMKGSDAPTCCQQTCSGFQCPAPKQLIEEADKMVGHDDATCCVTPASCGAFDCPAGKMLRPDAAGVIGSDEVTCCKPTCSSFTCPAGQLLHSNADSMIGEDAATCCVQTCSSFTCPDGQLLRSDAAAVEGADAALCCEQSCSSFDCPDGQLLRNNAATIKGQDAVACCEPACSSFACPAGQLPIKDALAVKGSDAATCCQQTCSGFACTAPKHIIEEADKMVGNDEATCCVTPESCGSFACPAGTVLRPNAADVIGKDEATCCLHTCSGFTCPAGTEPRTDADAIAGQDAATCCVEITTTTVATTRPGPLMECKLNCYGDAATTVPLPGGDGSGVAADSAEVCRDYCLATDGCESIVFGQGMCYGKKDVKTRLCQPNSDYVTQVVTRMPRGTCILMGDPHILSFDNPLGTAPDNTQLESGDYVVVQSDVFTIHGRFGYSDRFPAEASLAGLSITGGLIKDQKLVVEYRGPAKGPSGFKVTWNGAEILSGLPSTFTSADGLVKGKKADMNPDEIHAQARHTIGGEGGTGSRPSFLFEITADITIYILMGDQTMNAVIMMTKIPSGMDGYCGNFNCLADDDTLEELDKRGLKAPLTSSSFPSAPVTAEASGAQLKSVNDCSPELLAKAEADCAQVVAALKPGCVYDVCVSGSTEQGAEDAMAAELAAKFAFMGMTFPKLADVSLSPQLQWSIALVTMGLAIGGFVTGLSTRLRGSSSYARIFHQGASDEEEEALLMPTASEYDPISREEQFDEEHYA